jgi:hypothetical protein
MLVLIIGGAFFTIGWGLVLARRDALSRVFDRVSGMMDDAGIAFTAFYNVLRMCRDNRGKLPADEEAFEDAVVKIHDELYAKGGATYNAMTRVGPLTDTILIFDRPEISAIATLYIGRLRTAQGQLLEIEPLNAEDDSRFDVVSDTLKDAFDTGEVLRRQILAELGFWRVIGYVFLRHSGGKRG